LAERKAGPAAPIDFLQLRVVLVDEALVLFEPRDEAQPLRAFHVTSRAELQLLEGPRFVVREERRAIREDGLVDKTGRAHRLGIEAQMEQLDVIDVMFALEVGNHRRRERRGVEARGIERRTEAPRLPAGEARAEPPPATGG